MDKKIKKKSQDIEPADMVDLPEGEITPDDIGVGGDFIGGEDIGGGGGDDMGFADELGGGAAEQPTIEPVDWSKVEIFPTGNLEKIIEDQEDFEIDFSKLV